MAGLHGRDHAPSGSCLSTNRLRARVLECLTSSASLGSLPFSAADRRNPIAGIGQRSCQRNTGWNGQGDSHDHNSPRTTTTDSDNPSIVLRNAGLTVRAVAFVLMIGVGLLFPSTRQAATPFFWSGFESTTALATPSNCWSTGCWQSITGTDSSTGYTWPPSGLASGQLFQLLADNPTGTMDPTTIGNYMFNQILPVTGHKAARSTSR
jgi:hypothetical protein